MCSGHRRRGRPRRGLHLWRKFCGFSSRFGFRDSLEVFSNKLRVVYVDGTRVRLLFRDANLGKKFD
jgi:hypothetical protein